MAALQHCEYAVLHVQFPHSRILYDAQVRFHGQALHFHHTVVVVVVAAEDEIPEIRVGVGKVGLGGGGGGDDDDGAIASSNKTE